ncbi:Retrovirus-related Pol polyprotein, partial [Mucuna pruriens]
MLKKFGMMVIKNRQNEMIHIAPVDQHKTTFTCPFGTFAYARMPFELCNAPSIFQRCRINISSDLLEDYMEVFIDDFTVYVESFESCLNNLSKVLRSYRQIIKDFSKVALPLSKLLQKDADFVFDQPCVDAFQELKRRLTFTPILQAPN